MISAILLAAGESSRMATPKALLSIHGITFAEEIARKAQEAGAVSIYLIGGAHYREIKSALPAFTVLWNPQFSHGQISSLKVGLRNLPADITHALVWPVDHPLIEVDTIRRMIEVNRVEKNPVTIPTFNGKRGHPVLYNREAIQEVLHLSDLQTAKELQNIFQERISYVEVNDPGVLIDIDLPDDYRKYIKDSGL